MSITCLSRSTYTIQRSSPFLLDETLALGGGNTPDRQPPVPSSIRVRAVADGSIVVSGTVAGSPESETLTYPSASGGFRATVRLFTAVTSITASGNIVGTNISAKVTGAGGTPHAKLKADLMTGLPGAFTPGIARWVANRSAYDEKRNAMIAFDWFPALQDIDPRRGDWLVDEVTGERWLIQGSNLFGGSRPHHYEIHATLWDGAAPA